MAQDATMSALRKIVFEDDDTPTIDEDVEDDSKSGPAVMINKITELTNMGIEEEENVITSENLNQEVSATNLEEIKNQLAKKGKVVITTNEAGDCAIPVRTKNGGIISINKPNAFGTEVVSAVKAALLMEIFEIKNSIVNLNPKLAPLINTTFPVYYSFGEAQLTTYKNLLTELLESSLFHENFIHFVEFIWTIMKRLYGHDIKNTNKISSIMSSPHFRILTRTWTSRIISPSSAIGRLIILIGTIKQTFGCHEMIQLLEYNIT